MMPTREGESDAALARRAAAGNEPAFGMLMRRHKDSLYRTVRRLTGWLLVTERAVCWPPIFFARCGVLLTRM